MGTETKCITYMLWESFEWGLIDTQDDITNFDTTAFCSWLARKQFFNPHHAGARGFVGDVLLSAKAETQPWCVFQQAHVKHIICETEHMNLQLLP